MTLLDHFHKSVTIEEIEHMDDADIVPYIEHIVRIKDVHIGSVNIFADGFTYINRETLEEKDCKGLWDGISLLTNEYFADIAINN